MKKQREIAIDNSSYLTSGNTLARNVVFNMLGYALPMLVALFAVPHLINGLGTDRFGVLTLAWTVIGYFSLFDFGLGRALTKLVAEKLGGGREGEIPSLIWTALVLLASLGTIGALIVTLISPWLVGEILKIPRELQHETVQAFYLLSLSIPVVISAAGLQGVLEAKQRFDLTNGVRTFIGAFTFLGPLLILPVSRSLFAVVAVLLAGRTLAWLLNLLFCFRVVPALRNGIFLKRAAIRPLVYFGGWMTVSNIISPVMVYLDRFLIGALLSVSAVAYYTTPYDTVTKLLTIPCALAGVLFPAFSASFGQDRNRAAKLYAWGVKSIFLIVFPLVLIIVVLAPEGLNLWLGAGFAQKSARVLQLLAVGVFFNSMAQAPFSMLQSAGRPDLVAKIHLGEFPLYLATVWRLVKTGGIEGAALAWLLRVAVDALLLFVITERLLSNNGARKMSFYPAGAAAILFCGIGLGNLAVKGLFLLLALSVFLWSAWFILLVPERKSNNTKPVANRFELKTGHLKGP